MKRIKYGGMLLLFFPFILNCSADIESQYYPLKKGTTWYYRVNQLTLTVPVEYRMIITNLGMHDFNGKQLFLKKMQNDNIQYYNQDSTGVYRYTVRDSDESGKLNDVPEKAYLFHFPLQTGTSWEETSTPFLMKRSIDQINAEQNSMPGLSQNSPLKMRYTIESMNETVEVPAGKFKGCMKVSGEGSCSFASVGSFARKIDIDVKNTDWYCPSVGLVKVRRDEISQRVSLDSVYYTIELEQISN